ncbi:MAG: hypothetical protein RLZZ618_902 [Pseudomonadota bacterium]|jgi:twitching motility protein PilJ
MSGDALSFQTASERTASLVQSASAIAPGVWPSVSALVQRIRRNTETLVSQKDTVLRTVGDLRAIRKESAELLQAAENLFTAEMVAQSPPARLTAASQMVMLTQRIPRSAGELLSAQGVDPEAVFLLRKDSDSFLILARGLRDGDAALRLPPVKTKSDRDHITRLITRFERSNALQLRVLSSLQGLVAAREAQAQVLVDADELDRVTQSSCASRGV